MTGCLAKTYIGKRNKACHRPSYQVLFTNVVRFVHCTLYVVLIVAIFIFTKRKFYFIESSASLSKMSLFKYFDKVPKEKLAISAAESCLSRRKVRDCFFFYQ